MRQPEQDLANRRPVWEALSELFLDTEMSPEALAGIAHTLANSPYSADELRQILFDEVHPACSANLLSVAGVWSGFDADRLQARILARSRARLHWPSRLMPFRRAVRAQADVLLASVAALRGAS